MTANGLDFHSAPEILAPLTGIVNASTVNSVDSLPDFSRLTLIPSRTFGPGH